MQSKIRFINIVYMCLQVNISMGIPFRAENSHLFPNIGKKSETIKIAENRCDKKSWTQRAETQKIKFCNKIRFLKQLILFKIWLNRSTYTLIYVLQLKRKLKKIIFENHLVYDQKRIVWSVAFSPGFFSDAAEWFWEKGIKMPFFCKNLWIFLV